MKKRVLFVEDDPHMLRTLECAFQPEYAEWDMGFVESAAVALELMEKERFDVLVSDLHMPEMDGAELLNQTGQKHPHIIRFILADSDEKEIVMKQVPGAHQFLAKPCEAGALKAAIQCALALDVWLGNRKLQELVGRIRTFPTLPSLYFEVMRELNSPNASTEKIGEIISRDLSMTTKMLRMLNSAYFGLSRQITDPGEAVGFLGLETVKSLILAIQVFSQYDNVKPLFFSIDRLWKHSTMIARSSKQIALLETGDDALADNAYTAGLLHDIGRLVLAFNFDEQYHSAQSQARHQQEALWEIEKHIFGASHAEVGAYLIGLWGMPLDILEAAALHHHPQKSIRKEFCSLTAVHAANALHYESHPDKDGFIAPIIDQEYLAALGLGDRLEVWRELIADDGSTPASGKAKTAQKNAPVAPPPRVTPVPPPLAVKTPLLDGALNWRLFGYAGATLFAAGVFMFVYLQHLALQSDKSAIDGQTNAASDPRPDNENVQAGTTNKAVATNEPIATNTPTIAAVEKPAATELGNEVAVAPPKPNEPEFPSLQLQGILYSPKTPRVIINGQTLTINDQVEGVKILSIGPMSVIVRFEGQTRILSQ